MTNQLALAARGPDLGRVLGNAATIRGAQSQDQLNRLRIGETEQAIDRRAEAMKILPHAIGGDEKALAELARFDPDRAIQLKQLSGTERAAMLKEAQIIGRAMDFVEDQPTLDVALSALERRGVNIQKVPREFDPKLVSVLRAIGGEVPKAQSALGKLVGDLNAGRISQQQFDQQRQIDRRPLTQIEMNAPGEEKEANKEFGKGVGKRADSLIDTGVKAQNELVRIQRMREIAELYKQAGGRFGSLAEEQISVGKFFQSVGMPGMSQFLGVTNEEAGLGETLISESNCAVVSLIGPGGFPANNFSEQDRKFLLSIPARIDNTALGFELKLRIAERTAQRSAHIAERFEEILDEPNPPSLRTAMRQAQKEFKEQPLFSEDEKAEILASARGSEQQPPKIDPALHPEGTGARDKKTGALWIINNGKWVRK